MFWYLATPYSRYADGLDAAFAEAARQAALLVRAGIPVYSPIAHTHPVAIHGGLDPLDHSIWLPADQAFMDAARGLVVCMMPGWDESYGIAVEIETFERAAKPVIYMAPGCVPEGLV